MKHRYFAALAASSWREALILAWREEYGDSPCDEILDVGELLRSLPLRVRHQNRRFYAWQLRPDIRFGDAPRADVLRLRKPTIFSFSRACRMVRSRDCNRNVGANTRNAMQLSLFKEKPLLENRIPSSSGSGIMLVVLQNLSEDKKAMFP